MFTALKSPLAKRIATLVVALCAPAAYAEPAAAPVLMTIAAFLVGAYHIDTTPPKAAP